MTVGNPSTKLTTATEYIVAPLAETVSPLTIVRAYGPARKAGLAYLEANHYMRSSGGSGQLFIVEDRTGAVYGACLIGATASTNCDRSIAGACLIGPAASKDAERSIAGEGVLIRQIKRSHLLDGAPMFEYMLRGICLYMWLLTRLVCRSISATTMSGDGVHL
jgi:hypothetical protein